MNVAAQICSQRFDRRFFDLLVEIQRRIHQKVDEMGPAYLQKGLSQRAISALSKRKPPSNQNGSTAATLTRVNRVLLNH